MQIHLYRARFHFHAHSSVHFPDFKSSNIFRGAFGDQFRRVACQPDCPEPAHCPRQGDCPYEQIFSPMDRRSPASRFRDLPRPLVFRASHLDGRTLPPGSLFHCDVHTFDGSAFTLACLCLAFRALAHAGLGPRRAPAQLLHVELLQLDGSPSQRIYPHLESLESPPAPLEIRLPMLAGPVNPATPGTQCGPPAASLRRSRIHVHFVTPTELKQHGTIAPPSLPLLVARIFDRLESLASPTAAQPIHTFQTPYASQEPQTDLPFTHPASTTRTALLQAADGCKELHRELSQVSADRSSSRTGQRHPLGGYVGHLVLEGETEAVEFLEPWLHAATLTGVGRQTVWGKGQLAIARG